MCFTIWAFAVFNVFEMHYASPRLYLYHNTEAVEVQDLMKYFAVGKSDIIFATKTRKANITCTANITERSSI